MTVSNGIINYIKSSRGLVKTGLLGTKGRDGWSRVGEGRR